MLFKILCAGMIITGNADNIVVIGSNDMLYAPRLKLSNNRWNGHAPGVYEDGGQLQITVARDRRHIWVNTDTDDIPGRGTRLSCSKWHN